MGLRDHTPVRWDRRKTRSQMFDSLALTFDQTSNSIPFHHMMTAEHTLEDQKFRMGTNPFGLEKDCSLMEQLKKFFSPSINKINEIKRKTDLKGSILIKDFNYFIFFNSFSIFSFVYKSVEQILRLEI